MRAVGKLFMEILKNPNLIVVRLPGVCERSKKLKSPEQAEKTSIGKKNQDTYNIQEYYQDLN